MISLDFDWQTNEFKLYCRSFFPILFYFPSGSIFTLQFDSNWGILSVGNTWGGGPTGNLRSGSSVFVPKPHWKGKKKWKKKISRKPSMMQGP